MASGGWTMSADSVLFIVVFVVVVAALAKWDDIVSWLTAGDAAPEGREWKKPAPVALSAAQELLLAEIYAASADFARRAQAQGIAPHSLKFPVGEEPVSVWHLIEDGWPSIGTNGVPYTYDSHEYHARPFACVIRPRYGWASTREWGSTRRSSSGHSPARVYNRSRAGRSPPKPLSPIRARAAGAAPRPDQTTDRTPIAGTTSSRRWALSVAGLPAPTAAASPAHEPAPNTQKRAVQPR